MCSNNYPMYCIEVWGDYACFTIPYFKVERVTYPIPTPSAARGIFDGIFWHPAIRWQIERIDVMNPIDPAPLTFVKNETAKKCSSRGKPIYTDLVRQQRQTQALRNVKYRLFGRQIYYKPKDRKYKEDKYTLKYYDAETLEMLKKAECPRKYQAIFERVAGNGGHFKPLYLGLEEFTCMYRYIEDLRNEPLAINETRDFGWVHYDMNYYTNNSKQPKRLPPFRAKMNRGTILIPTLEEELEKDRIARKKAGELK